MSKTPLRIVQDSTIIKGSKLSHRYADPSELSQYIQLFEYFGYMLDGIINL